MAAYRNELVWKNIDPTKLPAAIKVKWDEMKLAQRAFTEAKARFEQQMREQFAANLPENKTLKFSYNFGKLGIAVDDAENKRGSKAEGTGSLADWINDQTNGGHNT